MSTRSRWLGGSLIVAVLLGLPGLSEAAARGAKGGHSGGHLRAPRLATPARPPKAPSYKAPRMPRAAAPAHSNSRAKAGRAQGRGNTAQARAQQKQNQKRPAGAAAPQALRNASGMSAAIPFGSPSSYTYGSGTRARHYRAHGYGSGYRNRYYGGRYGYGRSQGNNRAIVGRLRSVHANLARINNEYQGHRARALNAVSMAIRQLTHRSMAYGMMTIAAGNNNRLAPGGRQAAVGGGGRQGRPMTKAESDARMGHSLRTLQGISMQLVSQGYQTHGHARAQGHVQRAIRELKAALAIR